jgi:uncharacterized protein (DUF2237 family)
MQTNLLGKPLEKCSLEPLTGFYRDGSCRTAQEDSGSHSVCIIATNEFLEFSKRQGNDLSTPIPEFGFQGLKDGDKWCLCALRWKEAYEAGSAPKIDPNATSNLATKFVDKELLLEYAI